MNPRTTTGRHHGSPQRTCIGCRRKDEQRRLLRLVRSPEGEVLVDHPHRLGGRGAYVCSSSSCVARALSSTQLTHHIGGPVAAKTAAALTRHIEDRLLDRIEGLLASAGRSRHAELGAAHVEKALNGPSPRAVLVVVARDLSSRVRSTLDAAAERAGVPILEYGDLDRLGRPFAREKLGAAALTDQGLAEAIREELTLLRGLSVEAVGERSSEKTTSRLEDEALERAT